MDERPRRPSSRRRRSAPQTTRPSPTCWRIRAVASSTNDAIVQRRCSRRCRRGSSAGSRAPRSVCADLRMELERVAAALRCLHGRDGRVGARRDDGEARRGAATSRRGSPRRGSRRARRRRAVSRGATSIDARGRTRAGRRRHLAAERVGHQLHAVADAEHRHAEVEHRRVAVRRARLATRSRAAGQDDADRMPRARSVGRHVERKDLGVDRQLAKPAGDELSVLGAEIEDDDGLMRHAVVSDAAGAVGRRVAS